MTKTINQNPLGSSLGGTPKSIPHIWTHGGHPFGYAGIWGGSFEGRPWEPQMAQDCTAFLPILDGGILGIPCIFQGQKRSHRSIQWLCRDLSNKNPVLMGHKYDMIVYGVLDISALQCEDVRRPHCSSGRR